jgi:type VI secretion system secreted protein VgrG
MPFRSDAPDDSNPWRISELFQRHDSRPSSPRLDARDRGAMDTDDGAANHVFSHAMAPTARPAPEQRYRDQLARRHLERLRCRQMQIHGQSESRRTAQRLHRAGD